MKRFWIFLVVGPFIMCAGYLLGGGFFFGYPYIIILLVGFYLFGAIPALLVCLVDHCLFDKVGEYKRPAAISVLGCVAGVVMAASFPEYYLGIAKASVSGAAAGLLCSLLSSQK
jgi:hypothetical protein